MIQLDDDEFPLFEFGPGFANVYRSKRLFSHCIRSEYESLRIKYRRGRVYLLTSKGRKCYLSDLVDISSSKYLWRIFGYFRVDVVVKRTEFIGLEQFKDEVIRAIIERQKGEFDINFLAESHSKILQSESFIQCINAIPKNM